MGEENYKIIAENRKARFSYTIEDTVEAGIVLVGSEVKSLRSGKTSIVESHASEKQGELFLFNANIAEYTAANRFNHEPKRPRKLLLKKRELHKLLGAIQRKGITVVPLRMYFNHRGLVKVTLGIAKGKREYEKRETKKKRDWEREKSRVLKENR